MMRKLMILVTGLLVITGAAQANLLSNPGFEEGDLGSLGSVTVPDWTAWGSSGYHADDAGYFIDTKSIKMWWDDTGIYQDFTATAGTEYTIETSAITPTAEPLSEWDGIVKLEWYDSSDTQLDVIEAGRFYGEIGGTSGDPVDTWKTISADVTAPANTAYGRLVLAMTHAGTWDGTTGGAVYYDETSVIPEPATVALLGLGGIFLGIRRKK